MATQYYGAGSFVANSAMSANRLVSISSNRGVGLCTSLVRPDGVTLEDAASGDYVAVQFISGPGTRKVAMSFGPVTVGSIIYATSSGIAGQAQGTLTVGKSLTTVNSGTAAVIEFIPGFQF